MSVFAMGFLLALWLAQSASSIHIRAVLAHLVAQPYITWQTNRYGRDLEKVMAEIEVAESAEKIVLASNSWKNEQQWSFGFPFAALVLREMLEKSESEQKPLSAASQRHLGIYLAMRANLYEKLGKNAEAEVAYQQASRYLIMEIPQIKTLLDKMHTPETLE